MVSTLIELTLISFVSVIFSMAVQLLVVDRKKMRAIQKKMNNITKELNTMIKNNAPKEEIEKKQAEITAQMSEMFKGQMKLFVIFIPLGLLLYTVLLPKLFLPTVTVSVFSMTLGYRNYFILVSFILGIIASFIIGLYDKIKAKEEMQGQVNHI